MKSALYEKNLVSITSAPTGPLPEMKRVVEKLTKLEKLVDTIFPDRDQSSYMRSERSSDSSRRSYRYILPSKAVWKKLHEIDFSTTQGTKGPVRQSLWSNLDPNMTTNIQKLFSEKVEIFGHVELQKSDILMATVKICLRVSFHWKLSIWLSWPWQFVCRHY